MYGDLLVHGPGCIDCIVCIVSIVCIVCIVCIVYIVYIVYVVYIVGVPEFQNPEFQAATVESGVDKDADSKLSIWGVPEFQNSRIRNSGILEFWNSGNGPF